MYPKYLMLWEWGISEIFDVVGKGGVRNVLLWRGLLPTASEIHISGTSEVFLCCVEKGATHDNINKEGYCPKYVIGCSL
jgi:hypothetical protein